MDSTVNIDVMCDCLIQFSPEITPQGHRPVRLKPRMLEECVDVCKTTEEGM
jgi:hypothetical protein